MLQKVLNHLKYVERAVGQLSSRAAFAFGLSCTERQWPVLRQSVSGIAEGPDIEATLREGIDQAWRSVLQSAAIADDVLAACQERIDPHAGGPAAAVRMTIAGSIVDLITAIQRNEGSYPHYVAYRNIDLIELLLDERELLIDDLAELSNMSVEIQRIAQLIDVEMERQDNDLRRLMESDSDTMINHLKRESSGASLFDGVWF